MDSSPVGGGIPMRVAEVDAPATIMFQFKSPRRHGLLTRHPVHGVPVPVIPPEDTALLKARMGQGPEVGKHDWQDVEAMMAFVSEFDWDYLRWRAQAILPSERRQQILRRLERIWDRLCATRQA